MSDWIKSDYCTTCDGEGYVWVHDHFSDSEKEQCAKCEHLHRMEVRADIQHDIEKGN